jgi:hypothetical protein
MEALHAATLLEVWEQGRTLHPVDRALVVLAFACPELAWAELCALPIGERNRLLLEARALSFGPRLDIVSQCRGCGEQVEFEFSFPLHDFSPSGARELSAALDDGALIKLRLPNSLDLAAIADVALPDQARLDLLGRCVLELPTGQGALGPEHLVTFGELFSRTVEEHDPLATIAFPVCCKACGQEWRALFDPIDYVWREVAQRVLLLLREVHVLARAYGWSEGEILNLSPARRQLYLEQVSA